jgi:hypothetical protein
MKLRMRCVIGVQRNHILATQALAYPLRAGIRHSVGGDLLDEQYMRSKLMISMGKLTFCYCEVKDSGYN